MMYIFASHFTIISADNKNLSLNRVFAGITIRNHVFHPYLRIGSNTTVVNSHKTSQRLGGFPMEASGNCLGCFLDYHCSTKYL